MRVSRCPVTELLGLHPGAAGLDLEHDEVHCLAWGLMPSMTMSLNQTSLKQGNRCTVMFSKWLAVLPILWRSWSQHMTVVFCVFIFVTMPDRVLPGMPMCLVKGHLLSLSHVLSCLHSLLGWFVAQSGILVALRDLIPSFAL